MIPVFGMLHFAVGCVELLAMHRDIPYQRSVLYYCCRSLKYRRDVRLGGLRFSGSLTVVNGTDRLPLNVGNQLSTYEAYALLFFLTLDAGLLDSSQYSEGPVTGHLDTGFSWFPCAYKQTLRCFPSFQVAITCFSCSPPYLNLVATNFMFCLHVK
jgi:hypothetical protein